MKWIPLVLQVKDLTTFHEAAGMQLSGPEDLQFLVEGLMDCRSGVILSVPLDGREYYQSLPSDFPDDFNK
jgi:hypothetical protein